MQFGCTVRYLLRGKKKMETERMFKESVFLNLVVDLRVKRIVWIT